MRYGISAATIVIEDKRILLVNHIRDNAFDFWVPPGGRLEGSESILDCAVRETFEETNLKVEPDRIVYIQEFAEPDYHFVKFYVLVRRISGHLSLENLGSEEGFLKEARYFSKKELYDKDIRPEILKDQFWADLESGFPTTRYLGLDHIPSQ